MTSVDSRSQTYLPTTPPAMNGGIDEDQLYENDVDQTRKIGEDISVPAPRFEAYTMTGNVILSKTNLRNNQHSPTGSASSAGSRSKANQSHKPLSPTNVVLHSPVLANRKSEFPVSSVSNVPVESIEIGDHLKKKTIEKRFDSVFECSAHDVHGFTLSTTTFVDGERADQANEPVRSSSHTHSHEGHQLAEKDFYPDRPVTPEIIDNRPVWTVNAPVGSIPVKHLPESPSVRKAGPRFREILKEETIITDTTILEITDTNTSTSYIIQSPRTPRQAAKATHIPSSPPNVDDVQVEEEKVDLKRPQMNTEVAPPVTRNSAFVHPESARACMEVFPLEGLLLDEALRVFLADVRLVGETQARQRVVDLFGIRYKECNPNSVYTRDSAFAVISAMLILNSDLYSQHRPHNSPNVRGFVKNLRELAACDGVPDSELERVFYSIKNEQLPTAQDREDGQQMKPVEDGPKEVSPKSGYLYRKSCCEPGGKRTRMGRRGWNKTFVVINELILEFYKKQPQDTDEPSMVTPLHHGYATVASDYIKRKFVFRFKAVDGSVSLFRASTKEDMIEWVVVINRSAALFSAPVSLPVGSQTMGPSRRQTAVKPMYPSKKSGLTPAEQLLDLRQNELRLLREIDDINNQQPQSRSDALFLSSQLNSFKNELERCRIYIEALSGSH